MANYLTQAINGTVRIGLVILPSLKASQCLLELASRTLKTSLSFFGINVEHPKVVESGMWDTASTKDKAYTYIHRFLPTSITSTNSEFTVRKSVKNKEGVEEMQNVDISNLDIAKGLVFYTAIAVVSTFVLNKLIGTTPPVYNDFSKYALNATRFDVNYDVIQLAINYVTKK